jgi:DNA-binding NtrC family response regulator
MPTILCVDDEPAVLAVLEQALTDLDHQVVLAASGAEAIDAVAHMAIDLILVDAELPGMSAVTLLRMLEEVGKPVPVVILAGLSDHDGIVTAMRQGAVDYVTKPVPRDTLELTVRRALDAARLRRENDALRQQLARLQGRRRIVGRSEPIQRLQELITNVAATHATVLIHGEPGTGKELIARSVHDQSTRRDEAFITVNCAALPEGMAESVFFGHEKGAFPGATARSAGAFERADGGTLLLDEVSELPLALQGKIFAAIQDGECERVGGRRAIHVDVRIIATTSRDLAAEVAAGRFRADLYYRLQVVPIHAPTLRERPDDIPLLVQGFLRSAEANLGVKAGELAPGTIQSLQSHSWPGNVRELANAVERAVILARGRPLTIEFFAPALAQPDRELPATGVGEVTFDLREVEGLVIARALKETGGNRARAARLLGISERTLRSKLNPPKPDSGKA